MKKSVSLRIFFPLGYTFNKICHFREYSVMKRRKFAIVGISNINKGVSTY